MSQDIDERYENALILAKGGRPAVTPNGKTISTVSNFLGRRLRVSITDGRKFIGAFMCTDRDLNLLLSGTQEDANGALPFESCSCVILCSTQAS
jgi:small nuclear ribonucleoprotein (snRNP)-like protein